jgi:hypothetical protein
MNQQLFKHTVIMDSKKAAEKFTKEGKAKTFVFNHINAILNEAVLIAGKSGLNPLQAQEPIIEALFEAVCMSYITAMHNKYDGDCEHPSDIMRTLNTRLAHALTDAYDNCHVGDKDYDS